jgi:hypothetical protein
MNLEQQSQLLRQLSLLVPTPAQSMNEVLRLLVTKVAAGLDVKRVSVWLYSESSSDAWSARPCSMAAPIRQ